MNTITGRTRFDILDDPLIRQVMRADGVSRRELSELFAEVAAQLPQTGTASNVTWMQLRASQAVSQLRFA